MLIPGAKRGKAYKFARPFEGQYRVVALYDNEADVTQVDKPRFSPIQVTEVKFHICDRK